MMNIQPSELHHMSLWEYEALCWQWSDAHSTDEIEAPDPETAMAILDLANSNPALTN